MTLLGNEFHNEIVLGTKECKKEFVCKRLKVGIRASSTLAWYKDGVRKNDEVMYNFKHGAELVFKSAGLKRRDCKVRQEFIVA